jgi:ubiquitin thioesterase protein OTUB1
LIHLGDVNKFYEELARLSSLQNILDAAGFQDWLYQDYADEAYALLKKLPEALQIGNSADVLHEAFNDEDTQMSIIYYTRVRHVCHRISDGPRLTSYSSWRHHG